MVGITLGATIVGTSGNVMKVAQMKQSSFGTDTLKKLCEIKGGGEIE